jgi:hypothetical protein
VKSAKLEKQNVPCFLSYAESRAKTISKRTLGREGGVTRRKKGYREVTWAMKSIKMSLECVERELRETHQTVLS